MKHIKTRTTKDDIQKEIDEIALEINATKGDNEGKIHAEAEMELQRILLTGEKHYAAERYKEMRAEIDSFMAKSETNRNRLLIYCLRRKEGAESKNICFNKILDENNVNVLRDKRKDSEADKKVSNEETDKNLFVARNEGDAFFEGTMRCSTRYSGNDDFMKLYNEVRSNCNSNQFATKVFEIMDRHNIEKSSTVYNNVMLRRQDFSRVTSFRCKNITRPLVWRIIVGLKCNLEEAEEVLNSAGYTIQEKFRLDIIMKYCIERKIYDIRAINAILNEFEMEVFVLNTEVRDDDSSRD